MPLDLLATLRDLVATPSVNPMGRAISGPEYFEHRLTDYLQQLFARFNIPTLRQTVAPLRDNLIARLDGSPSLDEGGQLILLEAHQDTVPVDGMTIPPFHPQVRDGLLYGRGSCDIKGGMAAMLAAMVRLAEELPTPRPTVLMACTVNEEHGFTGATALCQFWSGQSIEIIPRRPDAAIVAEPTNLNVVVAHKGMVRWRCRTQGRAAHSSQPERGENAIFRMARVLAALEKYQQNVVGKLADHPLCGRPTLNVGTINGGLSVNTVPDSCTIEIDRRLVPGEQPAVARQQVIDFLAGETALADSIQHEPAFMQGTGLNDAHNRALADRISAAAKSVLGRAPKIQGVPYGTDAFCYDAAGVPSVVFGPGSIDQAHTADEWVPLAEVDLAAEVLYRVMADWSK
jgi:acetylornithine deacetylase ArgE